MLVGVGGSGKQSLAKLASFLCGHEISQISVTSMYGVPDFKDYILNLYKKAGLKGTPISLILTDSQIINSHFLVYINDLLSTGNIDDLCPSVSEGIITGQCPSASSKRPAVHMLTFTSTFKRV